MLNKTLSFEDTKEQLYMPNMKNLDEKHTFPILFPLVVPVITSFITWSHYSSTAPIRILRRHRGDIFFKSD